jgi:mono/diheme cytochrome c family protein
MVHLKKFKLLTLLFLSVSAIALAQSKPWVVPAAAKMVKSPQELSNAASVKDGKTLYIANCSPCHGDKGTGNGAAAAALAVKPADHTSAKVQSESDGALFWKISQGRSPMPQYKNAFTEKQRWELVNYIRSLAK